MGNITEMGNVPQLVLANKLVTIIDELSKPKFLANAGEFCSKYKILNGLSSWTTKNKELRLLAPIADLFKRMNLGGAAITIALCQIGMDAPKSISELGSIVNSKGFCNFNFPKAVCGVGEIGHFLSFVSENIPTYAKYAKYAPGIGVVAECAEGVGASVELCESLYRSYQYINYESLVGGSHLEEEKNIASSRLKEHILVIVKCCLKLFSMLLGFYAYPLIVETAFSAASIFTFFIINNYKSWNAESKQGKKIEGTPMELRAYFAETCRADIL